MRENIHEEIERLSRAVSLTVFELDLDRDVLIPAYLLANLMSPELWKWRIERKAVASDGVPLSCKTRLSELQRQFHRYTFTHFPREPGGDTWGLLQFSKEENRLGSSYIRKIKEEYDETLQKLLRDNPGSQFGQIIEQPYYKEGYFPRLRNEILEVMNAYALISSDQKASGKCAAFAMLWAAALIIWGRFSPEKIVLIGNRAHVFTFLDEENGHLFNNTKWFSRTRIHNYSELSEFVKMVTTSTDTTFFYNPYMGMCHCTRKRSDIPLPQLDSIYGKVKDFLAIPLKHPDPKSLQLINSSQVIPDPLKYNSAEEYQSAILALAQQLPGSLYDFAQYAFRRINVPFPQAYIHAALRDYHTKQLSRRIKYLEDAFTIIKGITRYDSIFESRDRMALPDETLLFKTGSDRDKALLLFMLLQHSSIPDPTTAIGFSEDNSYVYYNQKWIDVSTLSTLSNEPYALRLVFNKDKISLGKI